MKDSHKAQLGEILSAFDAKRAAVKKETERRKTAHELFLEAFAEKTKSVIRPAMEELAIALRERGHDAEIVEQAESSDAQGRVQNARVTLSIFPLGERPRHSNELDVPHVAIIANSHSDDVYVHQSTMMPGRGGQAGSEGKYTLDSITADLVQQLTLKVLAQAMVG